VHKLVQKCTITSSQEGGSTCFDWRTLGSECGICFNAVPDNVSFLAGPLDALLTETTEPKARVVRQRAVAEPGDEIKPEQVQNNSTGKGGEKENVDQLSALLKQMKKKLKDRCNDEFKKNKETAAAADESVSAETEQLVQETGMEVCGVQYLFNPDSFTQTVENIFHYSFLIKKGEAALGVRTRRSSAFEESSQSPTSKFTQHQGLWVKPVQSQETKESTQAVVAFTMKDWRALVQGYDLQQGDLPHRTASKNSGGAGTGTEATAPSQSQESDAA
jgi:hypothetical protein